MKKLSKDHLIDGRVYSAGTEYEIIKEGWEGDRDWPKLSEREWESMTVGQLEQYLDRNDVNARDIYGERPLMFAVEHNTNKQVTQFLLDNGADVNARDEDGWTALMWASTYNSRQVIQLLIDKGADVNTKDNNYGRTPLKQAYINNRSDVAQLLIDNGAIE